MALGRPVSQINQLASLTAEWPPGVIVPAGEFLALGAGVGLGGLVSHLIQLRVDSGQLAVKDRILALLTSDVRHHQE